jgi:hypothetical protein
MTRPIQALTPSLALLALSLLPAREALALPIGDAFPCVVAPFDVFPVPPPVAPVVVVRPWSSFPPPVVVVRRYVPPPPPVVVVRPWTQPPPPAPTHIIVRPATPAVVFAEPEPEPGPVVTTDGEGGTIDDRGEGVRAARRVVVGGGFGGLMLAGPDSSTLSSAFALHLGVALRQASVGLRLDMSPDAVQVSDRSGRSTSASYLIGGVGFGYHFNADALIHPVVGAALELHALDPDGGETRYGFGLGARAGLEMEYPLDSGSLGIGVDVSGHRRFGDDDEMQVAATALGFGGTIDYRF